MPFFPCYRSLLPKIGLKSQNMRDWCVHRLIGKNLFKTCSRHGMILRGEWSVEAWSGLYHHGCYQLWLVVEWWSTGLLLPSNCQLWLHMSWNLTYSWLVFFRIFLTVTLSLRTYILLVLCLITSLKFGLCPVFGALLFYCSPYIVCTGANVLFYLLFQILLFSSQVLNYFPESFSYHFRRQLDKSHKE